MYLYVDRELSKLDQIEQMLVRSMRDWAVARQRRRCPVDAVFLRFLSHRLIGAVEPFHRFMTLVSGHGRRRIELACPCTSNVSEGEAILLSLMMRGSHSSPVGTSDISALLTPDHQADAAGALAELTSAVVIAAAH